MLCKRCSQVFTFSYFGRPLGTSAQDHWRCSSATCDLVIVTKKKVISAERLVTVKNRWRCWSVYFFYIFYFVVVVVVLFSKLILKTRHLAWFYVPWMFTIMRFVQPRVYQQACRYDL